MQKTEPFKISITIKGLPALTNQRRVHWRKLQNESRMWKSQVISKARLNKLPETPLVKAKLILTRHSSSEPDYDGLVGSFKNCIDALVEIGILQNDKMSNIGIPEYKWEKAKPGDGKIRIEVEADL